MTLGSSLGNSLGLGSSLIDATVSTRLWTPDDRDNLAWYDASVTSSVIKNVSNDVSQWNDLSGNANHLTCATGEKPGHNLVTQNNLPVMNFTGSEEDHALSSASTNIPTGSQAWLCVAQIDAVTHGSESLFSYGGWQTGAFQFDAKLSNGFLGRLSKDDNSTIQNALGEVSAVNLIDGDYHLFSIVLDSVAQQVMMRHDGDLTNGPVSDPNGVRASQKIRVMVNRGENHTIDGQFCELVVLDDATATSVNVCEGYLAHKWGIDQKLPSKHPFDLEPPGVIEQGATEYLTDENGNIMMDENAQPIII